MTHAATLQDLVAAARRAGADAADAVLISGTSLSVQRRLGKTEHVERSEGLDLGLRVFLGQRQAIVSSTDALAQLRGAGRARRGDGAGGAGGPLCRPGRCRRTGRSRSLSTWPTRPSRPPRSWSPAPPPPRRRRWPWPGSPIRKAPRPAWGRYAIAMAASNGFAGELCAAPAIPSRPPRWPGRGPAMERDYDYSITVHLADLDDPATHRPPRRGAARLPGSTRRRPKTAQLPVVYDPRVAGVAARPSRRRHQRRRGRPRHVVPGTSWASGFWRPGIDGAWTTRPGGAGCAAGPSTARACRAPAAPSSRTAILTTWILDWPQRPPARHGPTGHAAAAPAGRPRPRPRNL